MREIIYVLLPQFADHEIPFLSEGITNGEMGPRQEPAYCNKIAAASLDPVTSTSGFRVLPDYTFDTMPDDYAAIVLIGGYGWQGPEAAKVAPIIRKALQKGTIIGAICNAASWMASQGFLNHVSHTGNGLEQLKLWGGDRYTNEAGYQNKQAVSDHHIVTANGTGHLEFGRELLKLLQNDTDEQIAPTTEPWGQRTCYIADPDGNLIEISSFCES